MGFDIKFMFTTLIAAAKYIPVTLILAFVPLLFGTIFGTLLAVIRIFKVKFLARLAQIYVVVIRGIPLVLLVYIIYFQLTKVFDVIALRFSWSIRSKDINLIYVAIIAISIYATANISEVIRSGLMSVVRGQFEAAYSVGLTRGQALRRIVIPQALPVMVPSLCSNFIGLIKGSSIAYLISIVDIMNGAMISATANYKFLEAYVAAAIIYWIICVVIEKVSFILESYLNVHIKGGVL
ncbi:MAG: amino acid ABC transporter permease [Bacillota bacterium]|nr:amino acid ABC transporter permease [Bacillota bacterium]